MVAIETLVAIAVAKMVAQKIASCSFGTLKPYCCSLFCAFRDDLEDLEKELLYLEAQLKDKDKWLFGIEVADDGQAMLAQSWHRDAKQLAFEIEDTIDEFVCSEELYHESTCAHKASLLCSYSNPIAARVWTVKRMISETKKLNSAIKLNGRYGTGPNGIDLESRFSAEKETTSYDGPDPVIGRVNDLEAIVDTIKEHAKRLCIIAIVGPVGVGKTCLARLVFNHLDSGSRFTRRIWVYVHKSCSRVDIKRIARQVISQGLLAGQERPNADYTMQEITTKVHEILKRERCLIILDGLWGSDDDVYSLKQMFTSCTEETESVIIVTTHNEQIAEHMSTVPLYRLAPMLEGDYCSDIFVSALRGQNSLFPRYRKEIISRCEGIPLVADFLGSIVRNGGWDQRAIWENARGKDLWKLEEDYATTLSKELTLFAPFRLMFYNIPHGLRLCFAYCSVFPKGSSIHKRKLIQQWISLHMVESATHGSVSAEMNAENIIKQLKSIHLLQVEDDSEGNSGATGEVLRMHYMAYELARFISHKDILVVLEGEEAVSSFPEEKEEAGQICCFSQEKEQGILTYCDHRYAQLSVFTKYRPQKVRSLILRPTADLPELKPGILIAVSEVISGNKYLRVLDLSGCGITELPACVCQLKQLRYLDASRLDMKELPCVENSLRKLVYLNLQDCRSLGSVHESFGMLPSLKYLNLSLCIRLTKLPASFRRLRTARRHCTIDLSGCQESVMVQFNSELQGEQTQTEKIPDLQPDQRPQPDKDQNTEHDRHSQPGRVPYSQPDKVPVPQPSQTEISSMEDKIMGSHPEFALESTLPVHVADKPEESQSSLETNGGHCASLSSSNSTNGFHMMAKQQVPLLQLVQSDIGSCSDLLYPQEYFCRYQFSEIAVDENNPVVMDVPDAPLRFKIRLFHDYKQLAILPKLSRMGEGNRWITIDPENGRRYQVELVDAVGAFLFHRGWDILATTENLQEDDVILFLQKEPDVLILWATFPVRHAPPLGFSAVRSPPAVLEDLNRAHVIVSRRTPNNPLVRNTILKIFNKKYTGLIPKQQGSVAMRYVGSDLVLPGAIKTYKDGCAKMVKEWHLYAKQHSLTRGEIFVCKVHRGPGI